MVLVCIFMHFFFCPLYFVIFGFLYQRYQCAARSATAMLYVIRWRTHHTHTTHSTQKEWNEKKKTHLFAHIAALCILCITIYVHMTRIQPIIVIFFSLSKLHPNSLSWFVFLPRAGWFFVYYYLNFIRRKRSVTATATVAATTTFAWQTIAQRPIHFTHFFFVYLRCCFWIHYFVYARNNSNWYSAQLHMVYIFIWQTRTHININILYIYI